MGRRSVAITAAALVPLAWAVVLVRPYVWGSGTSTEISIDEVIRRYQQATVPGASTTIEASFDTVPGTVPDTAPVTAPDTAPVTAPDTVPVPPVLPRPGVYTYTTVGRDAVDALNGDQHTYAPTTTITILPGGCGVTQRWDVLVERWLQWQRCERPGGVETVALVNFDTFFGRSQTDTYTCSGDPRPVDAPPGTSWTFTCLQGDVPDVYTGIVVGVEPRQVGGRTVDTLHVRVSVDNGIPVDVQTIDTWYLLGTDLTVAETRASDTTNPSPVGDVHYTERYEINLTSLDPVA